MIEWREEGIILAARRHGESAMIVEVLTEGHGRHAGIVRGGAGRKMAPVLQPGAQVDAAWSARIEDHLGVFAIEPVRSRAAAVLGDRLALAGLNAVVGLLCFALPEREAYGALFHRTVGLLDMLGDDLWPLAYLRWEMALLEDLGFGLDLTSCAVTGATEGLAYVSPRTGRAVSEAGAGEYAPRLLPLPPILRGEGDGARAETVAALGVTGHFFAEALAPSLGDKPVPEARGRLMDLLGRG